MRTRVGYAGGTTLSPTYRQLGDHTECLQVDFDPSLISYRELLEIFWQEHRPERRSLKRQYMAAVFYAGEAQAHAAKESLERVRETASREVHTRVLPLDGFYVAEDYHQKYYLRRDADLLPEFQHYSPKAFTGSTVAARLNAYVGGAASEAQLAGELDSFGLSPRAQQRLLAQVRRAARFAQGS